MMIVGIFLIVLSIVSFYFGVVRNGQVASFLTVMSEVCYRRQVDFLTGSVCPVNREVFDAWKDEVDEIDRIVDEIRAVPYHKVLFSFKALRVENFFTEEQVKFLRGETHRVEDFYVKLNNKI